MALLFKSDPVRGQVFAAELARALPDLAFVADEAAIDLAAVRYIVAWTLPPAIERFTNLDTLFCICAGHACRSHTA
jgi:glyoxylate/hydroxypyruvate reductase A